MFKHTHRARIHLHQPAMQDIVKNPSSAKEFEPRTQHFVQKAIISLMRERENIRHNFSGFCLRSKNIEEEI
jgi:hypothetical protein